MSDNPVDMRDGDAIGARKLLARAAGADVRAFRGLMGALDDFCLPEESRLDERTRAALSLLVRGLIEIVETEIRDPAARMLAAREEIDTAEALLAAPPVLPRLVRSGLLRDPELMGELLGRVRHELLGAALPMQAPDNPERPSLINRFAQDPDRVVVAAAISVLIAESRRRANPEPGRLGHTELPAELYHRLIWWVAAALRESMPVESGDALDRALSEAAQRSLAAYDEGERLEAAAMRFAAAIDVRAEELGELLVEALGDRRIVLFTALLAHAMGVPHAMAREIVVDWEGDRLWLALRALELRREVVARIGYALCEADPRRDLESFADTLDAIAAIPASEARAALASMKLHPDYRAALLALGRSA